MMRLTGDPARGNSLCRISYPCVMVEGLFRAGCSIAAAACPGCYSPTAASQRKSSCLEGGCRQDDILPRGSECPRAHNRPAYSPAFCRSFFLLLAVQPFVSHEHKNEQSSSAKYRKHLLTHDPTGVLLHIILDHTQTQRWRAAWMEGRNLRALSSSILMSPLSSSHPLS